MRSQRFERQVYQLTDKDRALLNEARERLKLAPELALKVRADLPLDAVQLLAVQGQLGFHPDLHFGDIRGPALLFAYPQGVKARWSNKVIRWLCGASHEMCWRQQLLDDSRRRIYITEGETDTIALLSIKGIEQLLGGDSLIVALASASTMPDPEAFQGKEIIIVADNDEPGVKCDEKLASLFKPAARSIKVFRGLGNNKDLLDWLLEQHADGKKPTVS